MMSKRSELMKIVAVSIVLLFLVSGFSVMAYGSGSEKSISLGDKSGNISIKNSRIATVNNSPKNPVISNINVGLMPLGVAYDPSNGYVYVTNELSDNVSVINGATNTVIASIAVGVLPEGVAYDPSNGYVYVTIEPSNSVSVINGATNTVIGYISVGSNPEGIAYDPSNGYVYVTNWNSNSVSVINGATNTVIGYISVGSNPVGIAYDPSNGYVYVVNSGSNSVSVINGGNNTVIGSIAVGVLPAGVAYDPSNGYVYVTNSFSDTVSIISTFPQVIKKYSVTFTESGLLSGTSWSVTFNGNTETSTTNTISFTEPNGTYSFSIASINGYSVSPSSGSITVNGANVNQAITFTPVTTPLYTITFTESGLPSGTTWYVNLSNGQSFSGTGTTITFSEPNGTYSYTMATVNKSYAPSPSSGTFKVNRSNVNIGITFNLVTYTITFTENGLSSGTSWLVTLNNITKTSTNGTIIFNEPNGTYSYIISGISGYRANTYSGTINVNGNPVSNSITWTVITYPITITENGIQNGTSWSATLTGTTFNGQYINVTLSSTTNTITFNEPNGTYSYTIGSVSGYTVSPSSGSLTVNGANVNQAITFTPVTTTTSHSSTNYLIYIIIAVVVIAAAIGVAVAMGRRKK